MTATHTEPRIFEQNFARKVQDAKLLLSRLPEDSELLADWKAQAELTLDAVAASVGIAGHEDRIRQEALERIAMRSLLGSLEEDSEDALNILTTHANLVAQATEHVSACPGCDEVHGVAIVIPQQYLERYAEHREVILSLLGISAEQHGTFSVFSSEFREDHQ